MTQKDFQREIELFVGRYQDKAVCANTREEQMKYRDTVSLVKATIARSLRLCLQYPELAQEYLDSLPKATMD
jgi:hypothetical protein